MPGELENWLMWGRGDCTQLVSVCCNQKNSFPFAKLFCHRGREIQALACASQPPTWQSKHQAESRYVSDKWVYKGSMNERCSVQNHWPLGTRISRWPIWWPQIKGSQRDNKLSFRGLISANLSSSPDFATSLLCDPGHLTAPPSASFFLICSTGRLD